MTLHLHTRVLPGNRIEVTAEGLREGDEVEVTIRAVPKPQPSRAILDFLDSLPRNQKSAEAWAEFERQFREERNSWDR